MTRLTAISTVATIAVLGLSGTGHAASFSCSAPQQIYDEDATNGDNPITSIDVTYRPDDHGWRIFHHMANGQIAARAEQYAITDWSGAGGTKWTGKLYKRSNLHMVGEVKRDPKTGNWVYVESLYDSNRGDSMLHRYAAQCREHVNYTNVPPQTFDSAPVVVPQTFDPPPVVVAPPRPQIVVVAPPSPPPQIVVAPPSYQPPAYAPPSYQPPAYAPPSYQPPAYAPPPQVVVAPPSYQPPMTYAPPAYYPYR
jgi:hypothetical protein